MEKCKRSRRTNGYRHSEATRRKIGLGNKGKTVTAETREKLRVASTGKKRGSYSLEHGAAISAAKKGTPATPRQLVALAKAAEVNRGKPSWNKGKILPALSEEHRAKIGASGRGKKRPESMGRKVSAALKGRPLSAAHRQALSAAAKRRWARGNVFAFQSKLEKRIGAVLEPLGYVAQFYINGSTHPYDYGHAEQRIVIEVNGCFWHSHDCSTRIAGDDRPEQDEVHRAYAKAAGYQSVTLWQCQEKRWLKVLQQTGVLPS